MSEEILRALMQLFAIITKQDGGVEENELSYVKSFLIQQLGEAGTEEYFRLFLESSEQDDRKTGEDTNGHRLTSVLDSVRILGICKKINKTLNQSQKIVVLVRLFELVYADKKLTRQRLAIITTVSDVFRISTDDYKSIETFVLENDFSTIDNINILIISDKESDKGNKRHLLAERLDKEILILRIPDVNLYFIKYTGNQDLFLNGLGLHSGRIYLFARGSTVKLPKGKPIYYSDISTHFLIDSSTEKLSFVARDISYTFKNGLTGLRNVNISATHGDLIGIMGASGTGKTTLLNTLSGIDAPSSGTIHLNGINIFEEKEKLAGVIGYIPQDDLLIEELTVFENLFYNAKLCFSDKSDEEIRIKVENTLLSLGLIDKKELKVGSVFNKTISGGQRKRLNIALEMIREPSLLFVDEPTSGLSSRDSENVMDLLRELTLKGKLIFVVIHQPSSEIYKMFDRVVIMDEGGYLIYCGNPVEGVMYFKKMDAQINSEIGECPACGNVNPEIIFNIIEARVVDDYGNYTHNRKVSPQKWEESFRQGNQNETIEEIHDSPQRTLKIPDWFSQFKIYCTRDLLSKISNRQYVILTLLETPLLGFILSYIIRYVADPSSDKYIFRENENIPIYIFMTLIVALFIGLQLSAEEIFRDRKILKREKFLNLSRSGYLLSKISVLFFISAIQAFAFVLVANTIVEVKGMLFVYWFAFFTTAAYANMLGLNISASFDSAILIYILIPLVIIPMMVLSGAMFSFDKLNRNITRVDKVPVLAEFMPTKWSYEALMVHQFKDNRFEEMLYNIEKRINNSDFKQSYFIPELEDLLNECEQEYTLNGVIIEKASALRTIRNELISEKKVFEGTIKLNYDEIVVEKFNPELAEKISLYLTELNMYYLELFTAANREKNNMVRSAIENRKEQYYSWLDIYTNESVSDEVRKIFERKKILSYNDRLIQKIDPVFLDPQPSSVIDFRSHFYAPRKHFLGKYFDTYWFNMTVIWFLTLIFYITLYYDLLRKVLHFSFFPNIITFVNYKSKMRNKISFILILAVFTFSCKGKPKETLFVPGSEMEQGELKVSVQAMNEIIENISSPIEMAAVVKDLGTPFSSRYLSNLDAIDNHGSSFKMAYTLGILGADLGYLNVYEKTGSSVNYLAAINKIADGLKISQFFDFSTMKRLASSSSNIDSLMFLSVHSFNLMDDHLRVTDRSNLSALMITGVWIEGMYLATQVVKEKHDNSLAEYIGEQKVILNDILLILKNYQRDAQFADLIKDLELIKSDFDGVKISYELGEPVAVEKDGMLMIVQQESSTVVISEEILSRIVETTARIRNKQLTI